ncbi:hypothetical protein LZ31DRAFT_53248 [Colletotrichum somersetense]|nr:hypothetical protein LZ31DRAFT_53248 [Colletotrichum somersetense]
MKNSTIVCNTYWQNRKRKGKRRKTVFEERKKRKDDDGIQSMRREQYPAPYYGAGHTSPLKETRYSTRWPLVTRHMDPWCFSFAGRAPWPSTPLELQKLSGSQPPTCTTATPTSKEADVRLRIWPTTDSIRQRRCGDAWSVVLLVQDYRHEGRWRWCRHDYSVVLHTM